MTEQIINLSDQRQKFNLLNHIRGLEGAYRLRLTKFRAKRSNRQNALYWVAVVAPFADFLRSQEPGYTDEEAHNLLKMKYLRKSVANADGEVIGETLRSTTELSTEEFSKYIEDCVSWLADMFHIQCQMPGDEVAA